MTEENSRLKELEEMLERQIKRRDKEIRINRYASKRTTTKISRTRMLIKSEEKI